MQNYRVNMVGGTQLDVDEHEMAIIRATAAAALNGEATPIISVMVSGAGAGTKGPMINVLQVVSIDELPSVDAQCGTTAVASISTLASSSSSAATATTDIAGKLRPITSR